MLVGHLASGIKKLGIEGKPLKTQDGAVLPKVVTMVWLVIGAVCICRMALAGASSEGNSAFSDAVNFFNLKVYDKASEAYWSAVMRFSTGATYTVKKKHAETIMKLDTSSRPRDTHNWLSPSERFYLIR